jgi:hypothetical protein
VLSESAAKNLLHSLSTERMILLRRHLLNLDALSTLDKSFRRIAYGTTGLRTRESHMLLQGYRDAVPVEIVVADFDVFYLADRLLSRGEDALGSI